MSKSPETVVVPHDHPPLLSRIVGSLNSIQSYYDYEMGFLAGGVVVVVASL